MQKPPFCIITNFLISVYFIDKKRLFHVFSILQDLKFIRVSSVIYKERCLCDHLTTKQGTSI